MTLERGGIHDLGQVLPDRADINPSSGHILASGRIAALEEDHLFSRLCKFICGRKARKAAPDHDGIYLIHYDLSLRFLISSIIAGSTSKRSPTIP